MPDASSTFVPDQPVDRRMLELLEPFRPHRGRVLRLLQLAGGAPRFGHRMPLRGFQQQ